jgi:two-component system phosphate regulon sensor histidine kinase PhoR
LSNKSKAIPLTITLGSILLFFCLVLTILWNFVLIYNYSQLKQYAGPIREYSGYFQWIMLAIGCFFFVVIIVGVILFIVYLTRQIMLNQLQKNFIDSVTHELKTPLTSIKLYIETLKKHDLSREKKEDFLNIMLKDVERLDTLVDHILESAKLDHLARSYQVKEIKMEPLLNYCSEIITNRYNLEQGDITLKTDDNMVITSDPTALQLVLINLLDNSVKYSNDNIKIIIEAYTNIAGKVDIVIKDFGEGIPKPEINKIFSRFYRISNEITGNKKGSGLGLFIVKETINNLKGKIEVSSEGKNKGTTFKITLPGNDITPGKKYA